MLNQFVLLKIHGSRFLLISAITLALVAGLGWLWHPLWWVFVVIVPVVGVGVVDMLQTENSIIRNFPVLGHFRYTAESIAPEIHQYFVESNTDGRPFNKNQRDFVNKRAETKAETHPFGTEHDVYAEGYLYARHSIYPKPVAEEAPRCTVGGPECRRPYSAALFNISAMSYGSLSAPAVRALNKGASIGGFFHNTGEGGLTPYHLEFDADVVWEIGSGYFGCRTKEGRFDDELFAQKASQDAIKMIELKLSQGAKPGHGGVLPAIKNTEEIARIRGVEPHTKVVSPAYHEEFDDAEGLLRFIARMRDLCGGKPVGFKLCVGVRDEFTELCEAMRETGIRPDFVTVDGGEGGTGAAPIEFSNSIGEPLEGGLAFVIDTLRGYGLREHIRVIASGKIITAFDIIKAVALGADMCNSARGMMFALGCIQALKCDSNECPTGVTTHDPNLTRGLVVLDKATRVANFQRETVDAACELVAGMGFDSFAELERRHISKRIDAETVRSLEELYPSVADGAYLEG